MDKKDTYTIRFAGIIMLCNIFFVLFNLCILYSNNKVNERSEQLFVGQNRPLVEVVPLAVKCDDKNGQVATYFSVLNYSGFAAYNIGIDLKYGGCGWIGLWRRAREEKEEKGSAKGVISNNPYYTRNKILIRYLKSGKTTSKDNKGHP